MSVNRLFIIALSSPLAVTFGFAQATFDGEAGAAAANSLGCGPECTGTCFAGSCLFSTENVDDNSPLRTMTPAWPQDFSAARSSTAWEPRQPGLPRDSTGFLASKEQLSIELNRAQAEDLQLRNQNQELRRELARWKETGAQIAEREAKVVHILSKSPPEQALLQSPSSSASHTSIAVQPTMLLQGATRRFWDSSHGVFRQAIIIFGLVTTILCMCRIWYLSRYGVAGDAPFRAKLIQALNSGRYSHRFQPLLQKIGLSEYKVEISEINLGSFFAGSYDVRVSFRMGNGSERRTKVLKNSCGAFLRFDDVLELSACSSDPPCVVCVGDRRGDLAHVELAAAELIRLATRPHQEYFRTELKTCRASSGDDSGQRPYIALRIRNISAPVAGTPTESSCLKPAAGFAA